MTTPAASNVTGDVFRGMLPVSIHREHVHERTALDRTGPTGVESVTFAVRLVMTYDLGSSLCSQGGGGIIRAVVHDYLHSEASGARLAPQKQ